MYSIMRLLAIADAMESHHWQNFKRGFPQYESIRNEFNKVMQACADAKLTGFDTPVKID